MRKLIELNKKLMEIWNINEIAAGDEDENQNGITQFYVDGRETAKLTKVLYGIEEELRQIK